MPTYGASLLEHWILDVSRDGEVAPRDHGGFRTYFGADAPRQGPVRGNVYVPRGVHRTGIETQPPVGILLIRHLKRSAERLKPGFAAAHAVSHGRLNSAQNIDVGELTFFDGERGFDPRTRKQAAESVCLEHERALGVDRAGHREITSINSHQLADIRVGDTEFSINPDTA